MNRPLIAAYNLLGTIRNSLGRAVFPHLRAASDSDSYERLLRVIGEHERNRYPDLSKYRVQAEQYARSPWVYIAVQKLARSAALVNINVMKVKGEEREPVNNHEFEMLIKRPNPWQSQFEFIESTVGYHQLNGNAYWFLNGPSDAPPTEILVLRPDRMRVVAGTTQDNFIAGYVYTVDGLEVPLEKDEVIHFKRFNPLSDYYGLAPLEAIALAVVTDIGMSEWNRRFYTKDMAIPAGVVNIKQPVSEATFQRIKEQWLDSYGGNQRRTAFLKDAEVTYQDIGTTHRDMDFTSGRQFSKEEILLGFGVPPGLVDKNATEANAIAAYDVFMSQTIWPIMTEFCQKITAGVMERYGEDLLCEPDDIRVKDNKAEAAELMAFGPYMTINEARERYMDLEPVEWGEAPATGSGAEASAIPEGSKPEQPEPLAPGKAPQANQEMAREQEKPEEEKAKKPKPSEEAKKTVRVQYHMPRSVRKEITQFAAFAAKRLGTDREQDIDRFQFLDTPQPIVWALKGVVSQRSWVVWLSDVKAMSGQAEATDATRDTLAKEKLETSERLQVFAKAVLAEQRKQILEALMEFTKHRETPIDSAYWQAQREAVYTALLPLGTSLLSVAAAETADILRLKTGEDLETVNVPHHEWAMEASEQFVEDTRLALMGTFRAAFKSGEPTADDLALAISENPVFGYARAVLFAEREASRLASLGVYSAAKALASALKLPMEASVYSVLDGSERTLFVTPLLRYDSDEALSSVGLRWHTLRVKQNDGTYPKVRGSSLHDSEALAFRPYGDTEIDRYFDEFERLMKRRVAREPGVER